MKLSSSDLELFRRIPTSTHKTLFHRFPRTFTGPELICFLKNTFDMATSEAMEWGNMLLQGNIIRAANFRLSNSFQNKSKCFYVLCPKEEENLFWLDFDDWASDSESTCPSDRKYSEDDSSIEEFQNLKQIPEIAALPFIGNALEVAGPLDSHRSMCILGRELCPKYGGIFRLVLMGHKYIVVSDPQIVQIIFDDPIFGKLTETDALFKELRCFRGEGLTTVTDGPLHNQCQGMIAPRLSKASFDGYIPIIIDTFNQCFREELGKSKKDINMKTFLKKCTLRSVGKIAMGIDLFEGTQWKSFVENLSYVADEAINRVYKGTGIIPLFNYKYKKAIKMMEKKLLKVIRARREEHAIHGKDESKYDLLDVMITQTLTTSASGEKITMSDEIIRANLNTILSAGHSTTTSMLSWAFNFLYDSSLGNTDFRYALIQEIAEISGGDIRYIPTMKDVYKRMNLMTMILKETIRLCPPIPTIIRHCKQTTNLCGYKVKKGEALMISCLGTHLNPDSWEDASTFNPHRFKEPPPHRCSFIPWAGGARQCVGREFALLSGRIGCFLLLNQYSLELSPNARVREDEHLFVFPHGLLMNAHLRKGISAKKREGVMNLKMEQSQESVAIPNTPKSEANARAWDGLKALIRESGHKVNILAGTKTAAGSTNSIAQLLLDKALEFNFKTGDSPMTPDSFLPLITEPPEKYTIVAICVSTYQGNAAENTKKSVEWLKSLVIRLQNGEEKLAKFLENVNYFVFGCGNMNWASTFQKVAKFFDENLRLLGAKQICPSGFYDESQDDLEDEFSSFYKIMAPKLMHGLPEIGDKRLRAVDASTLASKPAVTAQVASSAFQMDVLGDSDDIGCPPFIPNSVDKKFFTCPVRSIANITPDSDRCTLHIDFELQKGMCYRAGDHLSICPVMPDEIVERALSVFVDYDKSTIVRWAPQFTQSRRTQFHLPTATAMTIGNIFRNLLDLKGIPTKQFLANYATIVEDSEQQNELEGISGDTKLYREWIGTNTPIGFVDVIERFPPRPSELGRLMEILPVLKPRPYSICSSPKLHENSVQICVGVVEDSYPDKDLVYQGVSSFYLKRLMDDDEKLVNVFVEPADEMFDVPKDDSVPMIMISAGTGFAPMRSFLQERKARKASGEIFVFFGCRSEEYDYLYADELKEYQEDGIVTDIFVGFSRSKKFPAQYVQAKIAEQGDLIWDALDNKKAHLYVCGSGTRVGVGTRNALLKIISTKSNCSEQEAESYLDTLCSAGRYEQDVWG